MQASYTKGVGVKYLNTAEGATYIGLAYSPGACEFIEAHPELVDYVEIPFEQLRHTPKVGSIQEKIPVILHCASMSVAGFVPPEAATLDAIASEAKRTSTPWIASIWPSLPRMPLTPPMLRLARP